jgi:hypothetical protein
MMPTRSRLAVAAAGELKQPWGAEKRANPSISSLLSGKYRLKEGKT